MNKTIDNVTIRRIEIPIRIDSDNAADFNAMVAVRNQVFLELQGHSDDAMQPITLLSAYQPNDYEQRIIHVIEVDSQVVGRAGITLGLKEDTHSAEVFIEVLRDYWSHGIGSRALGLMEDIARQHGRRVLQSWVTHAEEAGVDRLEAPTGFGTVPRDHAARFLQQHGFILGQIERRSAFDLTGSMADLAQVEADALAHSQDYETVTWMHPTPPELVDGYAWLKSRMSTDTPTGEMEFDEEVWDEARVRAMENSAGEGTAVQVTAARHRETGELAAFNELTIGPDRAHVSDQWDTLVLKEHRGHRLGALVKTAGIRAWRDRFPDSPRIITYNAEENRPMLSINEAIGFHATEYVGAWKKVLN